MNKRGKAKLSDQNHLYQQIQRLIRDNKLDEAEDIVNRILLGHPEDILALNKKGVINARLAKYEAAEECFTTVINIDPLYAPAWSNLGNISLQKGQVDQAILQYERAIQADPDYNIAYENLAAAYRKQGKLEQSVATMKKTKLTRKSGSVLGRLVRFFRNMGV